MRKLIIGCVVGLMSAAVVADNVKVDMEPGLWDMKMTWTGDGAKQLEMLQKDQMSKVMEQMKTQLASLPPEQRKQMEAMMAKSGMQLNEKGMSFQNDRIKMSEQGTEIKNCVTEEEIKSGNLSFDDDDAGECSTELIQLSKNKIKSIQVCSDDDNETRSESEVEFHSPKHYSGKGTVTQNLNGQSYLLTMTFEGKWQSANCGAIQPD